MRRSLLIVSAEPTPPPTGLADRVRATLAGRGLEIAVSLVEAHGDTRSAATRVNAAASGSDADLVLVLLDARAANDHALAALVQAAANRPGLALAGPAGLLDDWTHPVAAPDYAGALATAAARGFAEDAVSRLLPPVAAFAAPRAEFVAIRGLDARLHGVGDAVDLALRALAAGIPVELVADAHVPPATPPIASPQHALLSWRNATLIALRQPDAASAGALLGHVATLAVATAWRAAGLAPSSLRFGGDWARQGALDRLLRRTGVARNDTFWPRDEVGSLVPLLGLDAALELLAGGWGADVPSAGLKTRGHVEEARDAHPGTDGEPPAGLKTRGYVEEAQGTHPAADGEPPAGLKTRGYVEEAQGTHLAADGEPPAGLNTRGHVEEARDAHPVTDGEPPVGLKTRGHVEEARGASRAPGSLPLVSVIVVTWNGEAHLEACFSSLAASDWPADRLELVCVDNGSTDGSRALMAARFPGVRLVALGENRGFTGGNNAGVAAAAGDVLVFFNNDMRVAPDAVRRLVDALDARHPCAAARVLNWDGDRIDFVRGTISFEARGFQEHYGEVVRPELSAAGESFFPNGGAFAITREAYGRAGGFDDRFFAYYDDIDLGWGVRLAGGHVRVVPEAVVHHRHGATSSQQPRGQKRFLMERNAVWAAAKRYGDRALRRTFGAILLLAIRRIVQDCGFDRGTAAARALAAWSPRLGTGPASNAGDPATVAASPLLRRCPVESLAALGEAVRQLPDVVADRHRLDAWRVAPDEDVLPRLGRAMEALSSRGSYVRAQKALVARLGLERLFRQRTRVLVVTHEALQPNMSGPGVRTLELGRALAARCRVTLATPFPPEITDDRCRIAQYSFTSQASMRALAEDADVIVLQGFTLARYGFLARLPATLVVDLYCPFTIEHLEMRTSALAAAAPGAMAMDAILAEAAPVLTAQNEQLLAGDFFLCASERQRDFWIGALQTAGRLNARTYAADPTLRSLIDVVPFGLPDEPPPPAAQPVMKGVLPGVGPNDRVLLWAGSILDWQDPQNLVRAVAHLAARRRDVKLVFMGTRHPNPAVPPMRAVEETIALARELGVLDTHVVFNPWVPYHERHAWLQEADLGVSTHRDHLETRLSFRTRMLDYLWAAVPIVCTRGDVFADLVEQHGLGLTVPPEDVPALAAAIERLLDDDALRGRSREALRATAARMRWSQVTAPLLRFCLDPRHAADRAPGVKAVRARLEEKYRFSKWLKRTALELGVPEGLIERAKETGPVRALLVWRNRVALARAQRGR